MGNSLSEIMVLRKVFGPNREEVKEDWRKLHSGELSRLIISRRMRWAGHVARTGKK
jgi:hypothetical protein